MNKTKKYCVDLDMAKKLKEKGFPQNTKFRWEIDYIGVSELCENKEVDYFLADIYAAPTYEEIINLLPRTFYLKQEDTIGYPYQMECRLCTNIENTIIYYGVDHHRIESVTRWSFIEYSEGCAEIWLHLKFLGIIK